MTLARRGLLTVAVVAACSPLLLPGRAAAQTRPRQAFVFLVEGVGFPDLLPLPGAAVALMSGGGDLPAELRDGPLSIGGAVRVIELGSLEAPMADPSGAPVVDGDALLAAWRRIRATVGSSTADRVLVVIACTRPPRAQPAALTPITVASGAPGDLVPPGPGAVAVPGSQLRALTSDSTRRIGVVSYLDVVPTIRSYLGLPPGPAGAVMRRTDEPWPFDLFQRYLAMRRLWFPIQTAAALFVTAAGLVGVGVFLLGSRVPPRVGRFTGWLALSVIPLSTALLAAGHLRTLSSATVLPFVIGITVASILVVVPLQRFGASAPTAALGAGVLAYFAVEAALGWTAALTPFLGGPELDGGRFFGLPNVFIGLLIGSSLLVAARLPAGWGFVLVAAVGFFAGLPWTGSNLGGAVALFAAAGLWLVVRTRPRPGWQRFGIAAGVVVAGTGLVLLAHRYLTAAPTHVTRFEETSGGLGGVWGTFVDRLGVGWDLIRANPFALVPVIGVVATLAVVVWPPRRVRGGLAAAPDLAEAIVVTLVAGVVAYVANDTGPAAVGLAFGLGLGGLLYVLLAPRTGMMEGS